MRWTLGSFEPDRFRVCMSRCLVNPGVLLLPSLCWDNELPSLTGMNLRDNPLCSGVGQNC